MGNEPRNAARRHRPSPLHKEQDNPICQPAPALRGKRGRDRPRSDRVTGIAPAALIASFWPVGRGGFLRMRDGDSPITVGS